MILLKIQNVSTSSLSNLSCASKVIFDDLIIDHGNSIFFLCNSKHDPLRAPIEHKALLELGYIFSLFKLCISCVGEEDGGREEKKFIPSQIPLLNGQRSHELIFGD